MWRGKRMAGLTIKRAAELHHDGDLPIIAATDEALRAVDNELACALGYDGIMDDRLDIDDADFEYIMACTNVLFADVLKVLSRG